MNNSQKEVLDAILSSRDHTFVSGEAGTGKSVVLREFVNRTQEKVVVCAPTGLAATHVNGVTIHSLLRFPVLDDYLDFHPTPAEDADKVLAAIDAVVIDEASMVRCDMFDAIDAKLRLARESDEPFGGARVVLFGDLLQLPPVANGTVKKSLDSHYDGVYFFDSRVGSSIDFVSFELTEVMRQQDPKFVGALKRARIGMITDEDLKVINTRVVHGAHDPPTPIIALTNEVVNNQNRRGLARLDGQSRKYVCEWRAEGSAKRPEVKPCEGEIELKVGCPVLFTRNDEELGVSNGTRGTVTHLDQSSVKVRCGSREIKVGQSEWPVYEYAFDPDADRVKKREIGQFLQLPMRLGFAMTVHKSQGQTYDKLTVDFANSRPFSPGQGYVAISRVRGLDGLTLTRKLRRTDFKHSTRAADFLARTVATADSHDDFSFRTVGRGLAAKKPIQSSDSDPKNRSGRAFSGGGRMLVPVPTSEAVTNGFLDRGFSCPKCGKALEVWQSQAGGPHRPGARWAACANDCDVSDSDGRPTCFMVNCDRLLNRAAHAIDGLDRHAVWSCSVHSTVA